VRTRKINEKISTNARRYARYDLSILLGWSQMYQRMNSGAVMPVNITGCRIRSNGPIEFRYYSFDYTKILLSFEVTDYCMASKFIVIEGPDGSGTTRQSALLTERLRKGGETVVLTAEPTESTIGQEIRDILHRDSMPSPDAIQLLFCADRANHVATIIEPALKRGHTVVCDRYALSTIVYGTTQGVDSEWLEEINDAFPKPDITFITLPPFEVCMERINRRRKTDQFEMENFQRRVYEQYKSIEDPSVFFVDTSGPKKEVADTIEQKVREYFSEISEESTVKVR